MVNATHDVRPADALQTLSNTLESSPESVSFATELFVTATEVCFLPVSGFILTRTNTIHYGPTNLL